jgi:hypothetical protein
MRPLPCCRAFCLAAALPPGTQALDGLWRGLIQTFELGAMRCGVRMISLGAVECAKDFYCSMGYRAKESFHKELPLPGRALEHRLRKLEG